MAGTRTLLAILALVAAGLLASAARADTTMTPVSAIVRHPARYYGKAVWIQATVSKHIDHRVWEMANGRIFAIKDDSTHPAPQPGDVFRLAGRIWPLKRSVIHGRLGIPIEQHFYTDAFLRDDTVIVVHHLLRVHWPIPVPHWFWPWANWYLHRGAYAGKPFRAAASRPASAPYRIPQWAWNRLLAIVR